MFNTSSTSIRWTCCSSPEHTADAEFSVGKLTKIGEPGLFGHVAKALSGLIGDQPTYFRRNFFAGPQSFTGVLAVKASLT